MKTWLRIARRILAGCIGAAVFLSILAAFTGTPKTLLFNIVILFFDVIMYRYVTVALEILEEVDLKETESE